MHIMHLCKVQGVFSKKIKYIPGTGLSRCVHHLMAGRTPALQQNWQSWEKSKCFKEKHPLAKTWINKPAYAAARVTNNILFKTFVSLSRSS